MEATEVKGKLILQCLVYIPILQGQPPQVTPFYPISNEPKVERCWAFILPLNVWTHSRSLFLLSLISGIQYSLSFCMKSLLESQLISTSVILKFCSKLWLFSCSILFGRDSIPFFPMCFGSMGVGVQCVKGDLLIGFCLLLLWFKIRI